MNTYHPASNFHQLLRRHFRLILIVVIFCTQLNALTPRPAKAFDPLTIGGLIALSQIALDKIDSIAQNALNTAGDQVRHSIDALRDNLQTLIQSLSQTYQDNLSLTIDQLDAETANKLIQIQGLVQQVNQSLQDDINLVAAQTHSVLNDASTKIAQEVVDVQQRINSLVVVASAGVIYVVDRTLFNVILIVALILFGLGILLFVYLIFSRKMPNGIMRFVVSGLIIVYLIVFGALALVPSIRAQAMSAANLGFEKQLQQVTEPVPEVVGADPQTITIGETALVKLIGVSLRPADKAITARIGSSTVPVAGDNRQAILNVSGLALPDGPVEAVLLFNGVEAPRTRAVLTIAHRVTPLPPPDLVISSFTISPSSPVQRGNATATIRVTNQGGSTANNFVVQWKPFASHPGLSTSVSSLAAGSAQNFTFNHSYINAGTVDSVAIVDVNNSVQESNEGNNTVTRNNVVVQTAPPRRANVTVRFTQVTVNDDADPLDHGEMWLDFNVGGKIGRFPSSGTKDVHSGDSVALSNTFVVLLTEGDPLSVFVNGTDEDNPGFPLFDNNDPMGTVNQQFLSGTNWGEGSHNVRSTCPDGCYNIAFTISVQFLN